VQPRPLKNKLQLAGVFGDKGSATFDAGACPRGPSTNVSRKITIEPRPTSKLIGDGALLSSQAAVDQDLNIYPPIFGPALRRPVGSSCLALPHRTGRQHVC
jgi:hypothetical protein